jgi:uncharacterized BrkB/YihY/UPF0761 family membrane protein
MNKEKHYFEEELDNQIKNSVLLNPSEDLEDKIMYQINASHSKSYSRENIGAWVRLTVYSILGLILVTLFFIPSASISIPDHMKSIFSIEWMQTLDLGFMSFSSNQSYLAMTVMIFAASVWLIILFNHPKKETLKKYM